MGASVIFLALWCSAFFSSINTSFGFQLRQPMNKNKESRRLLMSKEISDGSASSILSILKKPSKILSIGLEFSGDGMSQNEISILSMQLRKCKVSSIWASDIDAIQHISDEQKSAIGNFPGPCPVIYCGPIENVEEALQLGACAVVLNPGDDIPQSAGEIVWKVECSNDVQQILDRTNGNANVFLSDVVDGNVSELSKSIPSSSLWIAALEAMQEDGNEIILGKQCKAEGCGSILIKAACIGDDEDIEYAQFCVGGMTSKASSEFKFSGLTGSTNGHFGGVQSNSSVKWKRSF